MIYSTPAPEDALDQGDLIEECPVLTIHAFCQFQYPVLILCPGNGGIPAEIFCLYRVAVALKIYFYDFRLA